MCKETAQGLSFSVTKESFSVDASHKIKIL